MDKTTKTQQSLTIPEYVLHPKDIEVIRAASERMNINIIEYAQLAPYLYARDLQWESTDSIISELPTSTHNQHRL